MLINILIGFGLGIYFVGVVLFLLVSIAVWGFMSKNEKVRMPIKAILWPILFLNDLIMGKDE